MDCSCVLSIDGPVVTQETMQVFLSNETCPNVSLQIQIDKIQNIAPLTYELTVSSSDGCVLQVCPMLVSPGERVLTITLLDGVDYNAVLEVSNDCGSDSTIVPIQPRGKICTVLYLV